MDLDEVTRRCLALREAVAEYPFGPEVRVFKVCGKMFAIASVDGSRVSLKCDPTWATVLRDTYPAITPGYHLNKQHWNTIALDGSVPEAELAAQIDHAYDLVVKGLKKADRVRLGA